MCKQHHFYCCFLPAFEVEKMAREGLAKYRMGFPLKLRREEMRQQRGIDFPGEFGSSTQWAVHLSSSQGQWSDSMPHCALRDLFCCRVCSVFSQPSWSYWLITVMLMTGLLCHSQRDSLTESWKSTTVEVLFPSPCLGDHMWQSWSLRDKCYMEHELTA